MTMGAISDFFRNYVAWLTIPEITLIDILEIVIIAYAFYHIIIWIKDTRAWTLLKGMILLGLIFVVAVVLEMNVVLWVFKNAMVVGIMALVVIFQPELRNALEQLGRKNILGSLTSFDNQKAKNERYSERSIQAIIKAVYDMGKVKTGALIVVEKTIQCREYERTGIPIDAEISSQLLVNIFEHNTPLHDGAVLVRDNRIVAATCRYPTICRSAKNWEQDTGLDLVSVRCRILLRSLFQKRQARYLWPVMVNFTAGSMQIRLR